MSRSKSSSRSPKGIIKPKLSRDLQKLQILYDESLALYNQSPLSKSITSMLLTNKQKVPLTKALSIGLGSLTSTNQSRRIKQLTIFMAITKQLQSRMSTPIKLYAQDPTFTKVDEAFLQSLGITITRTPSPSTLGEAGELIDEKTMVYTPFLTIQAYRSVLENRNMGMLVGDDFNALRLKWPKFTGEHDDVERLVKQELVKYSRRVISQSEKKDGNFFWEMEDKMFPMALYWRLQERAMRRDTNHLEKTISARL